MRVEAWSPLPFTSPASPWEACSVSYLVYRLRESWTRVELTVRKQGCHGRVSPASRGRCRPLLLYLICPPVERRKPSLKSWPPEERKVHLHSPLLSPDNTHTPANCLLFLRGPCVSSRASHSGESHPCDPLPRGPWHSSWHLIRSCES